MLTVADAIYFGVVLNGLDIAVYARRTMLCEHVNLEYCPLNKSDVKSLDFA